jgi:hypothetical protein
MSERAMICIPQGGLNDMFNQIILALDYCAKRRRKLYIHTSNSTFGDEFSRYFMAPENLGVDVYGHIPDRIRANLQFDIADFDYSEEKSAFVSKNTGRVLRFDFTADSDEEFALHNACGGGTLGEHFLKLFRLRPDIQEIVQARLDSLPSRYLGVHVRNTDYKTHYKDLISQIADKTRGVVPVYLATDSNEVLRYAESIDLGALNFSHVPEVEVSLHTTTRVPKYDAIVDQLSDLLILSFAPQLVISKMIQGSYSGYSVLAMQGSKLCKAGGKVLGLARA